MRIFKKLLSFAQPGTDKPMHAGEIYYLWETLTTSFNLVSLVETYMMSTEDKEMHLLLKGLISGAYLTRINGLSGILKQAGFTVPPQPAPKSLQGKPGIGQEVKLGDDEVIRDLTAWGQVLLQHDARGIGASTEESVRKVFTDLVYEDMKAYMMIVNMGKSRRVYSPPPPRKTASTWPKWPPFGTKWGQGTKAL